MLVAAAHRALLRGARVVGRLGLRGPRRGMTSAARGLAIRKRCPASRSTSQWTRGRRAWPCSSGPRAPGKSLTLQCLAGLDAARCRPHRRGRPRALRRGGGRRPAAAAAPRRLRLPGLRAVPAPHRAPATSASACATGPRAERRRAGGRRSWRVSASTAFARALPARAVGRPAAAGRPGARARRRSRAAPARRAALRARRCRCAARCATSCAAILTRLGHRRGAGHPRPHRGLPARRPHRGLRGGPCHPGVAHARSSCGSRRSERVARIMGLRNRGAGVTVLKATPDRIQFRWRGQMLEAVNSPTRAYLPAPDSPLAFFIRPEYVRLIRKDRDGCPTPPIT